ncbi:MAG: hypothetical protein IJ640_10210 [Prevotella sp.]|nr:hypothetical protein [Prevotella sp.]
MRHFSLATIRKLQMPTDEKSAIRKTKMILSCGLAVAFCSWSAAEDYRQLVKSGESYADAELFGQNMMRAGFGNVKREVLSTDAMCDKYIDLHQNFRNIVESIQSYQIYPFELVDYETFCKSLYDGGRLPRFRKEATMHYSIYSSAVLNYSEGSLSDADLINSFIRIDLATGRKRPVKPFEFRQFLLDLSLAFDEMWLIWSVRTGHN